jgi:hypothetical protein
MMRVIMMVIRSNWKILCSLLISLTGMHIKIKMTPIALQGVAPENDRGPILINLMPEDLASSKQVADPGEEDKQIRRQTRYIKWF